MSAGEDAAAREAEMLALLDRLTLEIAASNAALKLAAEELRFEDAAVLRDKVKEIKGEKPGEEPEVPYTHRKTRKRRGW